LAIQYNRYSGLFIGLAAIFRPYAIVYSILLNKTQLKPFILITVAFIGVMLSQGILFEYAYRIFEYGMDQRYLQKQQGFIYYFLYLY